MKKKLTLLNNLLQFLTEMKPNTPLEVYIDTNQEITIRVIDPLLEKEIEILSKTYPEDHYHLSPSFNQETEIRIP